MSQRICVIGSGFAGLSAACHLAKQGHEVTVLEKNSEIGGRARIYQEKGFTFDMGPSWYWMPDVFEHFFAHFGKKPSDYYELIRLDPSYGVKFEDEMIPIPAKMGELEQLFDHIEPGSSNNLRTFLKQAAYKYEVGINELVYKPGRSLTEFADLRLLNGLLKMDVLTSMRKHVYKFFKHPKLRELMEFPILFLGATPQNTPALYSLMNYADISLGTWYPMGGMYSVIMGMKSLAQELGVNIQTNQEVKEFGFSNKTITRVITDSDTYETDLLVAGADYHFVDQQLLPVQFRNYSTGYWDSRTMAPSSLLFYLGINKKVPRLLHHTLFFDEDFNMHAKDIYEHPQWPKKPLLYVSATSKTDPGVAPEGMENLVILIPVAPGLEDTDEIREKYYEHIMDRLEQFTETNLKSHVLVKKSYAHRNFSADYHSFKGNAYGLANTLRQTAILKPAIKNKKLSNLYFTGQLTVPGPGVPPSLISGEVVAKEIAKDFNYA
jgi:phytoene desaturase